MDGFLKIKRENLTDMPDQENSNRFNPFANYPLYLAFYQGSGTLTLGTQQTITCTFEVGQLKKGDIFLTCKNLKPDFPSLLFYTTNPPVVMRFDGITNKGFHLSSMGEIIVTGNILTTEVTCWLRTLSVDMVKDSVPYQVHYGLTNVLIPGPFPLHVEHAGVATKLLVKPVEHYENIVDHIRLLKMVDITCEAISLLADRTKTEQLTEVVDNLCYLLSVAQGTKISWLYQTFSSATGEILSRIHQSHVTKVFKANALIPRYHIPAFVEGIYSAYVANRERYQLNTRIIDLYLDAIAENDYLQVRGIKLTIALEAMKAVFANLQVDCVGENLLNGSAFKRLQREVYKQMPSFLEKTDLSSIEGLTEKIRDKLPELNRRAFKDLLDDIFERIHFQINEEEKKRFIQSRNKLVHEGRFHCEAEAQKAQESASHQEMVLEFFFLASIVDRVVLKLLGYQGLYMDNQIPGQSTEKWLA